MLWVGWVANAHLAMKTVAGYSAIGSNQQPVTRSPWTSESPAAG